MFGIGGNKSSSESNFFSKMEDEILQKSQIVHR